MYIFISILGAVVGSFLNLCIYRIPKRQSIIFPPSHSDCCNNRLKAVDLIPIFSYIIFKGKCRFCKEKLDIQYPIVEFTNSVLYLILFSKFGFTLQFFCAAIFTSVLFMIFVIDFKYMIIPNKIVITAFIAISLFKLFESVYFNSFYLLWDSILGILMGALPLIFISVVSRGMMGAGDIKFMTVIGIWFGFKITYWILSIGTIVAGIFGILLLILKNKSMKSKIALAPFFAAVAFIFIVI